MATIESQLKKLPDSPGVYLFYNREKELVYVGKATSLKDRVRSYFRLKQSTRPIEMMMHEVKSLKHKVTDSVLEAVILEANLIKKHQPRYNVLGKDNRSWNYIVITKDEYPEVKTLRQHEYETKKPAHQDAFAYIFGPYPGLNTRSALKILRQIFHFSSCRPGQKRPCLYFQMGQCFGVCVRAISPRTYRSKVIRPLVLFLQGKKKTVITAFEKQMARAAKREDYEEAARLRDQLRSLTHIQDITLINKSMVGVEVDEAYGVDRIEGYDISNLGASGKVGSLVVFDSAGPVKSEYKKFKIRTVEGQSDVDCLEEVIRRRMKHPEWPMPNILLIDGGVPQVRRVDRVLQELGIALSVVGIAKGPKRKNNVFIFPPNARRDFVGWVNDHKALLVQVRDEAHRFAISYQRRLRKIQK